MDENKLRGLMGLCVRARQATFGMDGCLQAVRAQKAGVVVLDASASEGTRQKYESACAYHGVPLVCVPKGLLQEATGRAGVAMTVAPGGLADQIRSLSEPQSSEVQQMKTEIHCGGASVE